VDPPSLTNTPVDRSASLLITLLVRTVVVAPVSACEALLATRMPLPPAGTPAMVFAVITGFPGAPAVGEMTSMASCRRVKPLFAISPGPSCNSDARTSCA
jgi:hypothetical protein